MVQREIGGKSRFSQRTPAKGGKTSVSKLPRKDHQENKEEGGDEADVQVTVAVASAELLPALLSIGPPCVRPLMA